MGEGNRGGDWDAGKDGDMEIGGPTGWERLLLFHITYMYLVTDICTEWTPLTCIHSTPQSYYPTNGTQVYDCNGPPSTDVLQQNIHEISEMNAVVGISVKVLLRDDVSQGRKEQGCR